MAISFNEVPAGVRVPWSYIEFDSSNANQGAGLLKYKTLLIGQKLPAGTKDALNLDRVSSPSQAAQYYGEGSMLHLMAVAFFKNAAFSDLTCLAIDDDGAAVAATGALDFTGSAPTEAGTLYIYVAGVRMTVAVAATDTAADIATAVAAEISAHTALPVTAAAAGDVVNLTARNGGEVGNGIDIRLNYFSDEQTPAGVAVLVTQMNGGATNPDIAGAISVMGDIWYQVIAMPYTDANNLSLMSTELADRYGATRQIDGVCFTAAKGTHSELLTLGDGMNSPHLSIVEAHESPATPYEVAAAVAAQVSQHGQADPARPFQTIQLKGIRAPADADRFTMAEQDLLLHDGISTTSQDDDGTVRIQRLITTYQTNAAGADDTSYLDVNTMLTLMYIRWDFRTFWLQKYPRHKLGDDGKRYGAGQSIMTPGLARAEAINRFKLWEELAIVEGFDQFKRDLIVERNAQDPNRLDFLMPPDLVNQLRVTGVKFSFLL